MGERSWRWTDLSVRAPLISGAVIAAVLTIFLAVSYRQVYAELLNAGHIRAQGAAGQLASLLAQSAQQQVAEVKRAAQDDAIRAFLAAPSPALAERARARLAALARPGQPPAELWNASGQKLLDGPPAKSDRPVPVLPQPPAPRAEGVGRFEAQGDSVFWNTIAAAPGGWVVQPRVMTDSNGGGDAIRRLVGAAAKIRLGNDHVWTDLGRRMPEPSVAVRPGAVNGDATPDDGPLEGAAAAIGGTPWLVLVQFPRADIVGPARVYLISMSVVALLLVGTTALAAAVLSSRVTRPLRRLTTASEALAAGQSVEDAIDTRRRDEIGRLATAFEAMAREIQASRAELEARVEERTNAVVTLNHELERRVGELAALTEELESFSYSVSHDLRAPLRHVIGFATLLEQQSAGTLNETCTRYVRTITTSATRMGRLVDDLLAFSRMGRTEMLQRPVDLNALMADVVAEAGHAAPDRRILWTQHPLPAVRGDAAMLRLAFTNLVSNAVKYTGPRDPGRIEIGALPGEDGMPAVYVKDNGVGFDMQYADKLFGVFQRLHSAEAFDGTGIGLANVRRIVHRHGGRAWATGEPDRGATFFVSLPAWTAPAVSSAAPATSEATLART
jgi:signal transduction histidine kinase